MLFKIHFVFIILIFFTSACNKHPDADYGPIVQGEIKEIKDAHPIFEDTLRASSRFAAHKRKKPVDFDAFQALLEITNKERKTYYKGRNDYTTIVISNPDSIQTYTYVTNLFPAAEIERLIFEGVYPLANNYKIYMRIGANLRIKFKKKNGANAALNRLNEYRSEDRRAITHIFKPGGMAFVLEDELCLYSINRCGGDQNIAAIDSIIFRNVFYSENFERLHTDCGMQPFKKLID
ncbi:MAG: hypothetical protein GQ574_20005 [Crocinitomix sp.]|nr:hypothetical protein [Crocinitomix sp.]